MKMKTSAHFQAILCLQFSSPLNCPQWVALGFKFSHTGTCTNQSAAAVNLLHPSEHHAIYIKI